MGARIQCLGVLTTALVAASLLAQSQEIPPFPQATTAAGAKTPPKTGGILGRVVTADTEAALGKVMLMLFSSEPQGHEKPLTARTNSQGEYEFKNVKPGRYNLSAHRTGYVSQAYGQKLSNLQTSQGTVLRVQAGETLSNIDLKMIRGGVIEGRVVDSDGEPLAHVEVMLERYTTLEGKRGLHPMDGQSTDDRGQYRIFGIAPGRYCVSAQYPQGWREDEDDSTYPLVYYPGTLRPQEAARIEMVPGGEVRGVDMTLTESKAFSISGKVLRADGKPAAEAMLSRVEENEWGGWSSEGGGVDTAGNFRLHGLSPGRYRLVAESRRSEKRQMASLTVEVADENISGLVLVLGDGGQISGKVVIEGGEPKFLPATTGVMLYPEGGRGMRFRADGGEVFEDQTFSFRNVMEGSYRFRLLFVPGNLYLRSARFQGEDALDQAFEIHNGEKITGAEIVLSANGGELTGSVKQEETGELVRGATIVLFSAELSHQGPSSRWTRTAQSDQQGNFQLRGLAPGEYLVCALLNHEAGAESASDYLQELAKNAKTVSIEPHSKVSESLLVQPAPAVE
jgi:sarcosine oxidase gamma subunit